MQNTKTQSTQTIAGFINGVSRRETQNGKPIFGLLIGKDWYNGFGETKFEKDDFVKIEFFDNDYGHQIKNLESAEPEKKEATQPSAVQAPSKPVPVTQPKKDDGIALIDQMNALMVHLIGYKSLTDYEEAFLRISVWKTLYDNAKLDNRTELIDALKRKERMERNQ